MRAIARGLIAAAGLAALAGAAAAAPLFPAPAQSRQLSNIVPAAGGCGPGFHRTRRRYCVPNRRAYYRTYPYWPGYYGDGHEPWNRPTPTDHIANRLNRQARGGWYLPY